MSLNLLKFNRFYNLCWTPNKCFHSSSIKFAEISGNYLNYDKDPGPIFIHPDTQKLLNSITRLDFEKVFRKRTVSKNDVEYKFMTSKQIEDEIKQSAEKARSLLQMPPIVKMQNDEPRVISNDPALKSFSDADFVFTDITFGLKNSERSVVIRKTDGVLETAPFSVKKRCFQIYFPLKGRKFRTPKMFEEEHLKKVLENEHYEFILDRLCIQFEPYEKEYHEISSKVYQHINETKKFDDLRSTRHFGPLAFFLAWHKIIDDLLLDMIKRDYLVNGVELISLMFKLNEIPETSGILKKIESLTHTEDPVTSKIEQLLSDSTKVGKTPAQFETDEICFEFIQNFVKDHAIKKNILELALQTYKERHDEMKTGGSLEAQSRN